MFLAHGTGLYITLHNRRHLKMEFVPTEVRIIIWLEISLIKTVGS